MVQLFAKVFVSYVMCAWPQGLAEHPAWEAPDLETSPKTMRDGVGLPRTPEEFLSWQAPPCPKK